MEVQPAREHLEVQILSADRKSKLRIMLIEQALTNYPSVALLVEVKDDNWFGSTIAWFAKEPVSAFHAALEECEKMRRGTATLVSMSPDEVRFQIESIDSIGHFMLSYRLTQDRNLRYGLATQEIVGAFDLDSEFINRLIGRIVLFFNHAFIPV